ncbi:MAG: T9SS type A sorting domain-containing protein [Lentimicrobiaceae bacterium]|nr:T9SS type A sorting domain-containing protein [Lentimicrobiaceae bacterium]
MKKELIFLNIMLVLAFKVDCQNTLYGPTTTNIQVVRAISNNGNYVAGQAATALREAFTWDVTSGNVITLTGGSFADTRLSEAYGVTDNNRVVGDFADPELLFEGEPIRSAGFWENGVWTGLGLGLAAGAPPASLTGGSAASCVTDDGNTIAGFCQTYVGGNNHVHPYSWTYDETTETWTGEVWAEPSNVTQGSAITVISGDGSIAAGWTNIGGSARTGIMWTSKEEYTIFGYGLPGDYSEFICMSQNGKYAGFRHNQTAGIYDIENDVYTVIPSAIDLHVNSISNDGMVIGTWQNDFNANKGFVWSNDLGYMDFNDFRLMYASDVIFMPAIQTAFDPTSFNSYAINAISPDGLSITILVQNRALVLKLGAPIVVVPFPKNLSASVSREERNNVVLTWEAPETWTEDLVEYSIYRDNVIIATVDADLLTYTDLNVDAGYVKYAIQAVYENDLSKITDPVEAVIVDTYQLPFIDNFDSNSLQTNYWTATGTGSSWAAFSNAGVEGLSGGVRLEVNNSQSSPFSASLISKPLDATEAEKVYVTYMVIAHYYVDNNLTLDNLYVDVSTDGTTWTNVSEYTFQQLIDWKTELLDISEVAAGELINVRIRVEGINYSSNNKWYYFDNFAVLTETPAGSAVPSGIIHKVNGQQLELAWQNPENVYGITYQQSPIRYSFGNEGNSFIAVQSFDAEELAIYDGLNLVSISSYINQNIASPIVPTALKLAVFADGTRVISQDITEFTPNSWNTFSLSEPFLLSSVNDNLKIGIEVIAHDTNELPLGADEAGRVVAGKGDLYSEDGGATWQLLSDETGSSFQRNWCIIGNIAAEANSNARTPDILGYNVYLNENKINDYLIFGQSIVTEFNEGCYTVRAFSLTDGISGESDEYCMYQIFYTITVEAYPIEGGEVSISGEGVYEPGEEVTIEAIENTGWEFKEWIKITEEEEELFATTDTHTFIATENLTLKAFFELKKYTVTLLVNNDDFGTVEGEGDFAYNEEVTVVAISEADYQFDNWTDEEGEIVSDEAEYKFNITRDITLTANFSSLGIEKFGVSSGFALYPNPFTNEINIRNPNIVKNVEITNIVGQKVKDAVFNGKSINTSNFNSGVYFVVIESITGEKFVHKIVKK